MEINADCWDSSDVTNRFGGFGYGRLPVIPYSGLVAVDFL
jgi:hypothetical protein